MSWFVGLKEVLAPLGDALFGWVKRRHERKMAEHQAELEIIKTHADYDVRAQEQRSKTWLDEVYGIWLLGMLTYAMFDDKGLERVQKFDEMPEFIQVTFLLIIGALFGWRTIIGPMVSRKAKVRMMGVSQIDADKPKNS